jgi:hypothetical protein
MIFVVQQFDHSNHKYKNVSQHEILSEAKQEAQRISSEPNPCGYEERVNYTWVVDETDTQTVFYAFENGKKVNPLLQ